MGESIKHLGARLLGISPWLSHSAEGVLAARAGEDRESNPYAGEKRGAWFVGFDRSAQFPAQEA
jgi:hypothetical protein